MTDVSKTIAPKSDQLNADDLIGIESMTIKVTKVYLLAGDQPIAIAYEGDNGHPFKPCKSMRRVLVQLWGGNGDDYIGRSMTLFRDVKVKFGGAEVGGIRISHLSHISEPATIALTVSKAVRKPFVVRPLETSRSVKHSVDTSTGEIIATKAKHARGTVTGDPEEGNLSGLGVDTPDAPTLQKVLAAYAKIGHDKEYVESLVGKQMSDWNMADLNDLREVFKEKKAEHDAVKQPEVI